MYYVFINCYYVHFSMDRVKYLPNLLILGFLYFSYYVLSESVQLKEEEAEDMTSNIVP